MAKNTDTHGIVQNNQEDLAAVFCNLAIKLNLPVPKLDKIESVHKLKKIGRKNLSNHRAVQGQDRQG